MNKLYLSVLVLLIFATTVLYKLSTDDESVPESVPRVSETNIHALPEQEIFVDSQSTTPPTKIDDAVQIDLAPVDQTEALRNERTRALEPAINEELSEEDGSVPLKIRINTGNFLQNLGDSLELLDSFEQDESPISDKASALYDRMYSELNQAVFQDELQSQGFTISEIECKSSACRIQLRNIENVDIVNAEGEFIDELQVDDLIYDTLSAVDIIDADFGFVSTVDVNHNLLIDFKLPEDGEE